MKSNWGPLPITLLSFLMIICFSVSVSFAEDGWVDYQGTGFSLRIPNSFRVTQTTPVEDFDIYRIYDQRSKQILGIYVGNAPQWRDAVPEGVELKKGTLGDKPLEKAEWEDSDGYYGQVLVASVYPPFPMFVHLWYSELDTDQVSIVNKILDTFQPNEQ